MCFRLFFFFFLSIYMYYVYLHAIQEDEDRVEIDISEYVSALFSWNMTKDGKNEYSKFIQGVMTELPSKKFESDFCFWLRDFLFGFEKCLHVSNEDYSNYKHIFPLSCKLPKSPPLSCDHLYPSI